MACASPADKNEHSLALARAQEEQTERVVGMLCNCARKRYFVSLGEAEVTVVALKCLSPCHSVISPLHHQVNR